MRRRAALAVAMGLSAALLGACGGQGREGPLQGIALGFNDNGVAQGVIRPEQAARLLAQSGVVIDRVQVDWRGLEPQPGELRWAMYDQIYRSLRARSIRPLFIFGFAPPWASGGSCAGTPAPCLAPPSAEHVADAARVAGLLAQRYPAAAGIEIWNEANAGYFWGLHPDPAAYAGLLAACQAAIRRASPGMQVVGGSLAGVNGNAIDIAPSVFLKSLLARGAIDDIDVLSVHAYPDPRDRTGASAVRRVDEVRHVLEAAHVRPIPLWVTETGVSTSGPSAVSPSEQARLLDVLGRRLAGIDGVHMVLFHTLVDPPYGSSNTESGYGVLTTGLRRKPAFCSVVALAGGPARC